MFSEYIDCFFKMKLQASGYPKNVNTEAEKKQFVADYKEHEGIDLDPKKIEYNPGLRQIGKLCCNSFWGKYAQRSNIRKQTYFTEPDEFYKLVLDDTVVVHSVTEINPNMVAVSWSMEQEFVEELPNTNPIIASYVTSYARLHLYSFLDQLGDRVLYTDTDSICYLTKKGQSKLQTGPFLAT